MQERITLQLCTVKEVLCCCCFRRRRFTPLLTMRLQPERCVEETVTTHSFKVIRFKVDSQTEEQKIMELLRTDEPIKVKIKQGHKTIGKELLKDCCTVHQDQLHNGCTLQIMIHTPFTALVIVRYDSGSDQSLLAHDVTESVSEIAAQEHKEQSLHRGGDSTLTSDNVESEKISAPERVKSKCRHHRRQHKKEVLVDVTTDSVVEESSCLVHLPLRYMKTLESHDDHLLNYLERRHCVTIIMDSRNKTMQITGAKNNATDCYFRVMDLLSEWQRRDTATDCLAEESRCVLHIPLTCMERLEAEGEHFLNYLERRHSVTIVTDARKCLIHIIGLRNNATECLYRMKDLLAEWQRRDTATAS